ncbi:hypothetical protein PGT21_007817 [Puccinia graminis f. sp. tritici]|uniref:Rab-GAP TBC domain-containing protein n=1 Tax=Puccinia graminis f. sp. tritici TaxID=56615 RepID=A0A5B0S9Q5_PUCGR|nr:hypothetical protein PGT21_007817 [Puccinia graminis f. sp. tritici]KAA1134175.1 hypothetical protein PGTUg99_031022 [Puccinia graminis f. sp. tritici]
MDWVRPDPELIRSKWTDFLSDPSISLNQLKRTAFQGKITILRSVYWRIFLGQLPTPPRQSKKLSNFTLTSWTFGLERSRSDWETLRQKYLRAPDGLWLEDSVESSSDYNLPLKSNDQALSTHLSTANSQPIDLGVNNPLSQHEDNPWHVWLRDLELRKIIKQDVIRTFPELDYFRQTRVQVMLINILHVYCKLHEDLGYRQGMHEVLGVLLETLDLDSLDPPSEGKPALVHQILSREYLEHDAFSLFSLLMRPMKIWYDPNLSMPLRDLANSQTTPLTSVGFVPSQLAAIHPAPANTACPDDSLVHPIVDKCASIFHVCLKHADPELWAHLEKLDIEPQLWGIRWLRLLFTREFTYQESLSLWDGIFAQDGTSLRLADFVCIAMLLRIREGLLESDYTGALQLILRFPRPTDGDSKIDLLLYQAILLYQFPTPDTVLLIIRQNVDLQLFTGELSSSQDSSSWFSMRRRPTSSSTTTHSRDLLSRKQQPAPTETASNPINNSRANPSNGSEHGSVGSKKGQSLTKSKSFLGALVDLRKSYSATIPLDSHLVSELSPSSTAAPLQSPLNLMNSFSPTIPKQNPSSNLKSQHTQCLANQEVGQALGLCVDALEQELFKVSYQPVDSSQGLALGALKHIRDVMLSGFSSSFDSNVMSPLIEYQSATTQLASDHQNLEHSVSHSSFLTFSPTSAPYGPSCSTTIDSPELTFNQSISEGSLDSIRMTQTSSTVLPTESPASWLSMNNERRRRLTGKMKKEDDDYADRETKEGLSGGIEGREREETSEQRPEVQPLSPSIFGTKLWIQANNPVSSSTASSSSSHRHHQNFSNRQSKPRPTDLLPAHTLPPDDGHFESLMLVESRHLSFK